MRKFELDDTMVTAIRGQFYPEGRAFIMYPSQEAAEAAAIKLEEAGLDAEGMMLASPEDVRGQIARTIGSADIPLPSAGSEADTARRFVEMASRGHWGVMVSLPEAEQAASARRVAQETGASCAQRYRKLVIEDMA